jgi:hypothetical protein
LRSSVRSEVRGLLQRRSEQPSADAGGEQAEIVGQGAAADAGALDQGLGFASPIWPSDGPPRTPRRLSPSVLVGARNCLDDLRHNGGRPRQVDTGSFRLGENMAAKPRKVVFRNDPMGRCST